MLREKEQPGWREGEGRGKTEKGERGGGGGEEGGRKEEKIAA